MIRSVLCTLIYQNAFLAVFVDFKHSICAQVALARPLSQFSLHQSTAAIRKSLNKSTSDSTPDFSNIGAKTLSKACQCPIHKFDAPLFLSFHR